MLLWDNRLRVREFSSHSESFAILQKFSVTASRDQLVLSCARLGCRDKLTGRAPVRIPNRARYSERSPKRDRTRRNRDTQTSPDRRRFRAGTLLVCHAKNVFSGFAVRHVDRFPSPIAPVDRIRDSVFVLHSLATRRFYRPRFPSFTRAASDQARRSIDYRFSSRELDFWRCSLGFRCCNCCPCPY